MKLVDELRKMRNRGRFVVSIDFVLESLRESQRHDNANSAYLEVGTLASQHGAITALTEGGD